jgi:hypothetical protein
MKNTEIIKVDHKINTYTCDVCGCQIDRIEDQSTCGVATIELVSEVEGVGDEPHLVADVLDGCGICFQKIRDVLEKELGVKFRRERR